jgi:DNA polymerase-4
MRVNKIIQEHYKGRKIIHIDMDCFFAAVEIKDKPELKNKPVAVAGSATERGVVTTCNYIARKFGVKSAMPSITAKKLCPNIIFLPVNIEKYKNISMKIQQIYKCYTKIIEPISLDEAYLDVTNSKYCNGNPEEMAYQMRKKILDDFEITASAGISSNKFLSKIASDWNKPNGQFSIKDKDIEQFVLTIPIRKVPGIGEKTEKILLSKGLKNCCDLQKIKEKELIGVLGKYGSNLYLLCRGIDSRQVESNKISKSFSVEDTYAKDLETLEECANEMKIIFDKLKNRLKISDDKDRPIKSCFIKVKYNDFKLVSSQKSYDKLHYDIFYDLLLKIYKTNAKPIRLLGAGIQFNNSETSQLNLDII